LVFHSDVIVPTTQLLSDYAATPTAIAIELDARCHVSIQLETPGLADRFKFRDANGKHVSVHVITENSHNNSSDGELVEGRSGVVSVSGRATQLVLFRGDTEVEVVPIDLVSGELNEVRH